MLSWLQKLFGKDGLSYEKAKKLARHNDPEVRRVLATREDVRPEILYFLAEDPEPQVRRAIALNESAPRHADLLLAHDDDHNVRTDLASKIAKLAPGLTVDEQDRVRRLTYEALALLARDQVTLVRQILSETLKDVASAPPEVIRRLARDAELIVSAPVLEFSPVLTDEDLLNIINGKAMSGALSAISRRDGVNEEIADAIAETSDVAAVAVLLGNDSAQIREETLDRIIDKATDIEEWHGPLVNRPSLPASAGVRLARFVAENLLEILENRKDFDPDTMDAVRAEVSRRLDAESGELPSDTDTQTSMEEDRATLIMEQVKERYKAGALNLDDISMSLKNGDRETVMAALAVRADVTIEVVEKIILNRSVKGTVSISWKAKLPMSFAVTLQKDLVRIAPEEILTADDGGYPLSEEDMDWQLDFFKDMA